MKHRIITIGIIACAFSACRSKNAPVQGKVTEAPAAAPDVVQLTAEQARTIGITVGKATAGNVQGILHVHGITEVPPESRYTISFPMSGYLRANKLIPGTHVAKGALMATLEDARFIELQQSYLTGKSRLAYAEADFQRQEELNKTKATSDKVYQQSKAEYETLKVQVKALSEQLKLIGINPDRLSEQSISRAVNIYAPISGFVSKVNVNPGKYINPGDVLFELTDASRLHLSLTVFEKDAGSLQPGQEVICYTNAEPQKKMRAEIHLINRSLDNDRSLEVHCDFKQDYPGLLPGTFLNAEIVQPQTQSLLLPEDAVVKWQHQYYVFEAAGSGSFKMIPVETGKAADGKVAVLSALPDSGIVLHNAYALLMKLKNSGDE